MHKELDRAARVDRGRDDGIRQGRGTLGKFANDPDAYNRLNAVAREPAGADARHPRGGGQHRQAAQGRGVRQVAHATTTNFESLSGRLNRNDNTMGKLLTEKELYDRFNSVMARLDKLAADIQNPKGPSASSCRTRNCMRTLMAPRKRRAS